MDTTPLKLVTIIAEAVVADRLIEEIKQLGASGYTVNEVLGEGSRGVHASEWEGRNAKIESLVTPEVADRILEHVSRRYFAHYAVIAYTIDAQAVRREKYRPPSEQRGS